MTLYQLLSGILPFHGESQETLQACVAKGKLHFGTWEQIFYGEFDGNRRKRVLIKIIGE